MDSNHHYNEYLLHVASIGIGSFLLGIQSIGKVLVLYIFNHNILCFTGYLNFVLW